MSASEQLAAIAKARQDRKHQREARPFVVNERTTGATTDLMLEATQGDVEEQAVVQDSSTTTKSSTSSLSHLPKLRIQPSSERSFTPSVPSSPSRANQDIVGSNFGQTQEGDGSSTTIAVSSPLRQTYSVAEIPPFRPSPSVSTHTSPASTPPPTNVVLAHGLLDRLKARRASQSASGSQCPTPSAYESGDNVSAATPPDRESRSAGSASSESVNEASTSVPCERAFAAGTHQSTLDRPLSPVPSAPESLPPLTSTSTAPSSFVAAAKDDDEGDDAISELSRSFANRERSKSRSRIYGRYGEEVEHDFAALSDIQAPQSSEQHELDSVPGISDKDTNSGPPSPVHEQWDQTERKERLQVEAERGAGTAPDKIASAPPISSSTDTFCEGYLSVPSGNLGNDFRESTSRYSVLTSETLSFRPTDTDPLPAPVVVLRLAQCERVDDEPAQDSSGGSIRPFSVVLKTGEPKYFACEKRSDRVRWILALENAIRAYRGNASSPEPAHPNRILSPTVDISAPLDDVAAHPSARPTELRQPMEFPSIAGSAPQQIVRKFDGAKLRKPAPRSIWSRPEPSVKRDAQHLAQPEERPVPNPTERVARRIEPLSVDLLSRYDARPLPSVPNSPGRAWTARHAPNESDLSVYATPDTEPPFRPAPTRPQSWHTRSKTEGHVPVSSVNDISQRSSSSLTNRGGRSTTEGQDGSHPANTLLRDSDTETVTTRRGVDTASGKIAWNRTLRDYETAGALSTERTKRDRTQLLSSDPFSKSATVEPQPRPTPSQCGASSWQARSDSTDQSVAGELLLTIRNNLEKQLLIYRDDKERQEMQAQAISALAHWVTEDTQIRQAQHQALGQAVDDIVQQVASLPQQLLSVLENAASIDEGSAGADDEAPLLEADAQEIEMAALDGETRAEASPTGSRLKKRNPGKGFIINPLSSFATASRSKAVDDGGASKPDAVKPKGPRMPGVRIWGEFESFAERLILLSTAMYEQEKAQMLLLLGPSGTLTTTRRIAWETRRLIPWRTDPGKDIDSQTLGRTFEARLLTMPRFLAQSPEFWKRFKTCLENRAIKLPEHRRNRRELVV
ncbi:hypothetical protein JCM3766R1_002611 [Sporobolomyces carnicolor]